MLTLNLSFKSSPFFQPSLRVASYLPLPWFLFTSCHLTSFVSIPSFAMCFICYHHLLVIHRSCLDTHLYSGSLKSPLFHLNWRVVVYLSSLWTYLLFFICRSCLNSILCGIYILGSYAHLPPLLHPCPLSPLNPRDTYALAHMLILNLPF